MTTWPTGPAPTRAHPPQPAVLPIPDDDAPLAAPAPPGHDGCEDPTCDDCRLLGHVAAVGAARICSLVGIDYTDLPREQQRHYEHVATETMAAMSEALIAARVVVEVGENP